MNMKTLSLIVATAACFCLGACTGGTKAPDAVYTLSDVIEVEGRQGVATDGSFYYVSGSTALYKYDMEGNLLLSNATPFLGLGKECNHIGDIGFILRAESEIDNCRDSGQADDGDDNGRNDHALISAA